MRRVFSIFGWTQFLAMIALISPAELVAQSMRTIDSVIQDELPPEERAMFYLDRAESRIESLEAFVTTVNAAAETEMIPYIRLMSTERDTKQIARKMNLAREAFKTLNVDAVATKAVKRRYHKLANRLIDADEVLMPLRYHLYSVLDPQSFPDLKKDAERLRGIASMFADPKVFESSPRYARDVFWQLSPAAKEFERVTKKYDQLIKQHTTAGRQLRGLQQFFDSKSKSFLAAAGVAKSTISRDVKSDMESLLVAISAANSDQAIAEQVKKLNSNIASIDRRTELLSALDPNDVSWRTDDKRFDEQIQQFVARLKGNLISADGLPGDNYAGKDREEVVSLAKSIYGTKIPRAKIVSIRIPDRSWTNRSYWRYHPTAVGPNNETSKSRVAWTMVELSHLDVCLIVADPIGSGSVLVERFRVEKRKPANGSDEKLTAITIPFFADAALRYDRPAVTN